jgi:hypothetical protein
MPRLIFFWFTLSKHLSPVLFLLTKRGQTTQANMSQLDTTLELDTMASDSISPDVTSTIAISAIYANDSTVNVAGRDQIFITNNYIVDPNCDQGIWINQPATQTHHSSRQNLPVVICFHPIYKLSWSSQGSVGRHRFVVHQRRTFRTVEGNG